MVLNNPSCPLKALNREGQEEADDLQLEALWRNRMDLPRKQRAQLAEDRLDVLADGLCQKLRACRMRPLRSLLPLREEFHSDLLEQILVAVVGVALVGVDGRSFGQLQIHILESTFTSASEAGATENSTGSPAPLTRR
jgi:hypothetical protein